jgi:glycerate kinase
MATISGSSASPADSTSRAATARQFGNRAPVVVIAPDSFKGSLSAADVAGAIGAGIQRALPDAQVRIRPMADGGEGTLDALLVRGGERRLLQVRGASGAPRQAASAWLPDGSTALETAEVVGITDPVGMGVPVSARSTLGLGDAIRIVLDANERAPASNRSRRMLVALGGSSTNDGGAGLLAALGVRFLDAHGRPVEPSPDGLANLAKVDITGLDPRLAQVEFIAMSDVDNPLNGAHGATAVFGPQKGVAANDVGRIDATLARYADLLEAAFGRTARAAPGAGAAGGLGYALLMLGAQFRAGAEVVADEIGLDDALNGADWLITGEGRSDVQTLHGKAPFVACRRAVRQGVPATLLSGAIDPDALPLLSDHFSGCFSPTPGPITLEAAIANTNKLLADCAEQLTRLRFVAR